MRKITESPTDTGNQRILNKNGVNANIRAHILPEEEMRKAGFTDYSDGYWYFTRHIKDSISFTVSICKSDPLDFRIDVLDEDFCQPYDYQRILRERRSGTQCEFARFVYQKVEEFMEELQAVGVLSGHVRGDYI